MQTRHSLTFKLTGDRANPVGLTIGTRGEVTHAHRLVPQQRGKTSAVTAAKIREENTLPGPSHS